MRSMMPIVLTGLLIVGAHAWGSDNAIGSETSTADQVQDKAVPKTVAEAEPKDAKQIRLPPGFKVKKRGDITLYCIKGKATGTRFPTEACYDEAQLHDYLLAQEQNNRDFDQRRAVCSNPALCAKP